MGVVLCASTALRLWRAAGCGLAPMPAVLGPGVPIGPRPHAAQLREHPLLKAIGIPGPLDVLVNNASATHASATLRFHVLRGSWPEGAVCRVSEGVYVTSPAVTFLQLCPDALCLPLVELLMELCGSYSMAPDGTGAFATHAPFATVAQMGETIEQLGRRVGVVAAREALACGMDASASPRETELAIIETLSARRGGYGLPVPRLNHRIEIGVAGREFTDAAYYVVDQCWPDRRVVVEYDSDAFHLRDEAGGVDEAKVRADRQRREALEAMGYAVVTITTDHARDRDAFDRKMRQVARALGVSQRQASQALRDRRRGLQSWLFNPAHLAANDRRLLAS